MISIFAWFGLEVPMRERFPMIRQAGFEGVTFWWEGAGDFKSDNMRNPLAYKEQPELAREAGLCVENIHAPFGKANTLWEDGAEGAFFLQTLLDCIDDCAAYGIPTMVVHPSCGKTIPPVSDIGLQRYAALIERAEQLNVNIAMENLMDAEPIARAAFLLDHFDSPRFGFCYDSGHRNVYVNSLPEAAALRENDLLSRFGHRLMALHLHDNDGTKDQHRLPFDETIDWPATLRRIKAAGYQGNLHLEVHHSLAPGYEGLSAEAFLAAAYERARKLETLTSNV